MNRQQSLAFMNKNSYHRRGLIKRGLALIGGTFFFGVFRSTFGAVKPAETNKNTKRISRGQGVTQHCIEGVLLGLPVQDAGGNKT
jgi:hypothetical protein